MIVEYDKNVRRLGVTDIMGIGDVPSQTRSPTTTFLWLMGGYALFYFLLKK